MIGIYIITNKINGHQYVGQSINIAERWKSHIRASKNKTYREYKYPLYVAFRKYGITNFTFEILEECSADKLNERELFWINKFDTVRYGYNQLNAFQPDFIPQGENSGHHKLSEADVIDIRTRYAKLEKRGSVYEDYKDKISISGFTKIWQGTTWKHIMIDIYTDELKRQHEYLEYSFKNDLNPNAKITLKDVLTIRSRRDAGEAQNIVYKDYKNQIKLQTFRNIWTNKSWNKTL